MAFIGIESVASVEDMGSLRHDVPLIFDAVNKLRAGNRAAIALAVTDVHESNLRMLPPFVQKKAIKEALSSLKGLVKLKKELMKIGLIGGVAQAVHAPPLLFGPLVPLKRG